MPLLGTATLSIGFLLASADRRTAVKRTQRGTESEVLVDVCEVQAAPDHDDLGAVEKLGDLLAEHEPDDALAEEISQLLYRAQVIMIGRGLNLADVYKYL